MSDYKNFNKYDFDSRIDPRTYYDYLKLKDVNTKPFLMIAELIDNSIASFENEYGNQWKKVLEINIKMNFVGEEIIKNDQKVLKGTYIYFEDNAFGMDKMTLKNAVRLNNKSNSKSKMNVHGRGLKQCAFYFGIDLVIETKMKNQQGWKVKQMLSEQNSIDSIYYIDVKKSDKQTNGTEIKINNLHLDKKISTSKWDNIKKTLEYRYIKYLQKEQIKINYVCFFDSKEQEESNFLTVRKESKITIMEAFSILNEKEEKLVEFFKNVNIDINKTKFGDHISKSTVMQTNETIKKLFEKAKLNSQTLFEFVIELEIKTKNKKIPFQFWMLPERKAKERGIRFFEGRRAIKHICFPSEIETKPDMTWKYTTMGTGSTENRFAGSCNLSLLNLVSKTDKSSFTIPEETKKEIDKQIFSVWRAFDSFVIHARKEEKYRTGLVPSPENKNKLFAIAETKFPANNITYIKKDDKNNFERFQYDTKNNVLWKIDIKVDGSIDPLDIVSKREKEDENIEITIFTAHPFWHQITKLKKSFYIEAVIPVALLLAIQYIEWQEQKISTIDKNQENDTVDLFNISGNIFKDDKNY